MLRYILLDIEGTTTPIDFVHKVLFPYSRQHLGSYVQMHAADKTVVAALTDTRDTVKAETGRILTPEQTVEQLIEWSHQDRKHPALKTLQGLIWEQGYRSKIYTSDLYQDVLPAIQLWRQRGLQVGIYSSGSVHAQQLLFEHTEYGDVRPNFSDYFDTAVGGKKDVESYRRIASLLGLEPSTILFLSDVAAELAAAQSVGMQTIQVVRPGTTPALDCRHAANFTEVECIINH